MGMYYNRSRYYDVENGRLNAQDDCEGSHELPVSLNKYLYSHGNSVSYTDPTGNAISLSQTQLSYAIIGGLGAYAVTQTIQYANPSSGHFFGSDPLLGDEVIAFKTSMEDLLLHLGFEADVRTSISPILD